MSKLFKIKEWITVSDAAKSLSVILGEEVTEIDVLQLALEGKLSLSVRVSGQIPAKMAQITHFKPEHLQGVDFETFDGLLSVTDDHIVMIEGLFEMPPQTDANRKVMENAYRRVLGLEVMELKVADEIILYDKNGRMFIPQVEFQDKRISVTQEEELKTDLVSRKIARECYLDAQEIGPECAIVVRTTALRDFEKTISDQPIPVVRDESLLAVIATLLAQWPSGKPPTGKDLEKAAQAIGLKISDDTIRKALKAAREIAPSLLA